MTDKMVLDEIAREIRSRVAQAVAEGFQDPDDIVASVTEMVEDERSCDDLEPHVQRVTTELIEEHRRRQSEWVGPTDCDRLDSAFAALEALGIVARQNFSCCSNCGHSEIWGEIEEAREEQEIDGYVFYHMQDTEGAAEGGGLFLAYGATSQGDDAVRRVGERIAEELRRAGLSVEWNGNPDTRIFVPMEWRRRRP